MSTTIDETIRNIGVSPKVEEIAIEEVIGRLEQSYKARGWSDYMFKNDMCLLLRLGKHPQLATTSDLENVVLQGRMQSTRAMYVARFKSMYTHMRRLGLVTSRVDEELMSIKKPRSVPRPLTHDEALRVMTESNESVRDWFILGCRAGLRSMEVAGIRGEDFSNLGNGKFEMRIRGKGKTDLIIPAHRDVAEVFDRHKTLGKLWDIPSKRLSEKAGKEMRKLGIPPGRAKFHACRHYFATSVLEASGWDLLTTSKLMRHANVATTTGYTQLRSDRPREVLEML